MFLSSGGYIIKREGVSTLSIHGFPWALRYLLILKLLVCVLVLKSFILLHFNPCFCPPKCYEVVFKNYFESVCVKEFLLF